MFLQDPKAFFDAVGSAMFPRGMTQSQVEGINVILNAIPDHQDLRFTAYMLATTWWETAQTMQPIEEYGKGRGHAYGIPAGPWHKIYDGRGDVQETWYNNYLFACTRLHQLGVLKADEDLTKTPDLAMRPDVAAAIMIHGMVEGWFTGRKLADFFNARESDWTLAREIINGTDHDVSIGLVGEKWLRALQVGVFVDGVAPADATSPAVSTAVLPAEATSLETRVSSLEDRVAALESPNTAHH